jgi:flagellin
MNILGAADQVLLNIDTTKDQLLSLSSHLASGLRIQTAADDPSGNSISQGLQAKINGLQQSVENVQEGTNLLTVADGAAATIQGILQRINSLIIESNSDINSVTQLAAIQAEIDQELLEINRISQNANFNGVTLFDGSHDTYVAAPNAQPVITEVNPGLLLDGSIPTGDKVSNPQNPAAPAGLQSNAKLIQNLQEQINFGGNYFTGLVVFQVISASNNPVDPTLGTPLGQPGVIIQADLYSTSPSFANGAGNHFEQGSALPTNQGYNFGVGGPGTRPANQPIPSGSATLDFDMPNLTAADVGTAIAFEISAAQTSGGGTALDINDGGNEGTTIAISLPSLSTAALGISDISVGRTTSVSGPPPIAIVPTQDSSNALAAGAAQLAVGNALEAVSALRAQLGSQMVATGDDSNNDSVAIMNYTSAASSITDLNIGTATTQFTKDQILSNVGMSVLSQMQISAKGLSNILISALGAGGGGAINALA